ncbi:hypothetical protein [Janthinobacterium sp. HLX7-2]|uniref:hypothetical protein n=1 Tax=Janthinobacterium sp. HLX7-2 TaxID=1259331 RepID=UPI003F208772
MSLNRQSSGEKPSVFLRGYAITLGIIFAIVGLYLVYGGVQLITLGGSLYYAPAGLVLLGVAILLVRLDLRAASLYAAFFVVTAAWAVWETGLQF